MDSYHGDFISIETPRIRRFYEKFSKKEYETPAPQINNFLQLLTSPVDGHPLVKLQYMTLRHQDLINHHLENTMSALKVYRLSEHGFLSHCKSSQKAPPKSDFEGFLFDWDQPGKKLTYSQGRGEEVTVTKKPQNDVLQNFKRVSNEQSRSLRDITTQVNNASKNTDPDDEFDESENNKNKERDVALEVRKRKRKSNQQLKILQDEFERDGFWGKDKILSMARITGLSESQVYKWCWDQKKKKETDTRHDDSRQNDVKSNYSHEKENFSPIEKESGGLNKNSKHIFKTKNASNFNDLLGKSVENHRLKKHHKLRFESTVPKRIDFSLE